MRRLPVVPTRYKSFVLPALAFLILLLLTITLGRAIVGGIFATRANISQLKKEGKILSAKLDTLSSLNQDEMARASQNAIAAIPSESSTLFAVASLRELARARDLELGSLRVAEIADLEKGGVKAVELQFDTQGGFFQTLGLLNDLSGTAPLLRVSKAKFNVSGGSSSTKFTVISAWGSLPKTVGKITDPLETLTASEQELLGRLNNLRRLSGAPTEASPPQGRTNPFAF